jgi:CTP synthase
MSPYKHGEVFVMDDGCEADLDFGHYERFTDVKCSASDSLTTGKIYQRVLTKERRGDYLGSDIQVIPHVTDEIKRFILNESDEVDFTICEVGGTVGDIEGLPYIEAIRQLGIELGKSRTMRIHLTYLPYIKITEELKTKPTQRSVKELQSMGLQPDIILCRSEKPATDEIKSKLSMFCSVKKENIIDALDAESIYLVPCRYHSAGLDKQICEHFEVTKKPEAKVEEKIDKKWKSLEQVILSPSKTVKIAIVGKYTKLRDAYISLSQAICHGGFANDAKVEMDWIDAREDFNKLESRLRNVDGILVPGGFDSDGASGKIASVKFAREKGVPFFGICLGLQIAVIESCRNVAGVKDATSREFSETGEFVIDFMNSWESNGITESRSQLENKGGTMRLGNCRCKIAEGTLAYEIYNSPEISERHRHRFEVNLKKYKDVFKKAGLVFSGMSVDGKLPEIIERRDHSFFIATQAHPEFKSRPFAPHPLFAAFIKAAVKRL